MDGINLLIYNTLWIPFSYFLNFPPFTTDDKVILVAPLGALVTAIFWGFVFYLICSPEIKHKAVSAWWGKHICGILALAVFLLFIIGVFIYIFLNTGK